MKNTFFAQYLQEEKDELYLFISLIITIVFIFFLFDNFSEVKKSTYEIHLTDGRIIKDKFINNFDSLAGETGIYYKSQIVSQKEIDETKKN